MSPLLVVGGGTTPVLHEEKGQVTAGFLQIVRVERTQQGIPGDAQIEEVDQVRKELLTTHTGKECVHRDDGRRSRLSLDSRP